MDAVTENYPLRKPCIRCGGLLGILTPTNGQGVVRCAACDKWQYNAPKHEQGLAPPPMRSNSIKLSVRYAIARRVNHRCEFCGADASATTMHVAHLLSEKDIRTNGLPLEWADHTDNLAWLCEDCNAGMAERSFTVHEALVWAIKRQLSESE